MNLKTPLSSVLRTTKDHIEALQRMGISTVGEFLMYLPRSHEDLNQMSTITTAPLDEKVTIRGSVEGLKSVRTRKGKSLITGKFIDHEGGVVEVIWFNQPHIMRMLKEGDEVVMTGKIVEKGNKLNFQSPIFEVADDKPLVHSGRLVPVYPQHDIINTKWIREKMVQVKDAIDFIPETLPEDIIKEEKLMCLSDAVRALHFPNFPEEVERAKERMAFEKMFNMQLEVLERKREWQGISEERIKTPMDVELIKAFFKSLNFTPTEGQRVAIYEILKDMEDLHPMSRLLEGDVGSGKTLVAIAVIANAIKDGGQCALMVPTEVLAKQHVVSIAKTLINFHKFAGDKMKMKLPTVELLTGSLTDSDSKKVKQRILNGTVDLVIGTHALIVDNVQFKDLRLVIVDEQHRFGVEQRERLKDKGNPHFLAMTATPIPRTLALTAHGHHDLSVLLEKPGKRQPVHTKVVAPKDRQTVEKFINHEIDEGRQVFVICPLIQISDNEDMAELKSVEAEVARLRLEFPSRNIEFLHGKMTTKEKDEVMKNFKEMNSDILVSTSVIEVGIDIPNAAIICIEGAERFGLAQLHQFRGRVGRGDYKSNCFLFTTTPAQANSPRLKAMEENDSGFKLAEIDLQIRGPGELFGIRQSGIPDIELRRLFQPELVVRARRAAEKILTPKKQSI
ncbi:MAG: ATP-dependent DNA helicase RecG [Candidatus Peribacteraceae bacterium]|nr:ATP-dependent DNA helicase RecG [Candidatus Peribacteraceae bacterium]HCI03759.1 ATP-dependent DNA helicase RecG [Candidatus Peribacteria bacterium]